MTDKEFTVEIARGVGIIVKATIKRFGLSWSDFLPREKRDYVVASPLPANQSATLPLAGEARR